MTARDPDRDIFPWDDLPAEIQNMITELHVGQYDKKESNKKQHELPSFTAVSSTLRKHALYLFYKDKRLEMKFYVQKAGQSINKHNLGATRYRAVEYMTYVVSARIVGASPPPRSSIPNFHDIDMLEHIAELNIAVIREAPHLRNRLLYGRITIKFPYRLSDDTVFHPIDGFSLRLPDDTGHTAVDTAIICKLNSLAQDSKDGVVLLVDLLETLFDICHKAHKEFWSSQTKGRTPVKK